MTKARKTKPERTVVMIRLPAEFGSRLDALIDNLRTMLRTKRSLGGACGRSTVVREAMLRGIPLLEKEIAQFEAQQAQIIATLNQDHIGK